MQKNVSLRFTAPEEPNDMVTDRDFIASIKVTEEKFYQQLIADEDIKSNPLMPELQKLHELYHALVKRTDRLLREKNQLQTELHNLSRSLDLATRVDPMTGLVNRRAIMEMIEQEFSRANRHQRFTSIIMADLDYFRKLNERYGFNICDDVLVEVSRVLRGCLRSEDICARWGGEEFLLLLPETHLNGALAVASKIRESVAMTEFKVNKPGIQLTISLGVCEYHPDQDIFEAISRADRALLQAKQEGRNRAVIAP
jgi:diguanylate cyclase (GGDEF)-like protein